ncbi:hypothetical protein Slin15195_G045640 [Septoria linicola]|uniref:Uncharacterized protein n=1 Tax=Septoria linicola TaxID=215465 RepID=A0A9Q9ALL7_9PEZI|nr:hypothetical protein Slin14017_G049160 [Septoria linicola]USW51245.1 hypothetical protein Slin15195_G045640 [Septoria linicola]
MSSDRSQTRRECSTQRSSTANPQIRPMPADTPSQNTHSSEPTQQRPASSPATLPNHQPATYDAKTLALLEGTAEPEKVSRWQVVRWKFNWWLDGGTMGPSKEEWGTIQAAIEKKRQRRQRKGFFPYNEKE